MGFRSRPSEGLEEMDQKRYRGERYCDRDANLGSVLKAH